MERREEKRREERRGEERAGCCTFNLVWGKMVLGM